VCALAVTMLAIAIMLVISLIPLYLNNKSNQALGECEYKFVSVHDIVLCMLLFSFQFIVSITIV
jgi:hypothetical protein